MRVSLLVATFAAAAAATLPAIEATAAEATKASLAVQSVAAVKVQATRIARQAIREFRGSYAMDDGATLWLYENADGTFAEVSGKPAMRVVATSPATFAALEGDTQFQFNRSESGLKIAVVATTEVRRG